ncbi:MAG: PIN domain-containing protein [Oligoflexus sp.]|nr:PIN domain-containing protein [Oligoflexus sp.]
MSQGILLDTNVVSKLADKHGPSPALIEWLTDTTEHFYISAINYYEVLAGLHEIRAINTAERFKELLLKLSITILPVSVEIAELAAVERGKGKTEGKQRKMPDLLIGATAKANNLSLATDNVKDFDFWGVSVINPLN